MVPAGTPVFEASGMTLGGCGIVVVVVEAEVEEVLFGTVEEVVDVRVVVVVGGEVVGELLELVGGTVEVGVDEVVFVAVDDGPPVVVEVARSGPQLTAPF